MALPRPSDAVPWPRITAWMASPSRSASAKRRSARSATPSPITVPSASAEKGRQSPVRDSAVELAKERNVPASVSRSQPPVMTASHWPR